MASNNLKFQISAVDRTKQAFSAVKRGLGSVTKAVFSFKGALAGAVGIGGIGLLVKNSLEATDRIGKLSGVLGISTKDLQTFKLASEIGGIELETFAKGVRRFTDNIGDFKIGVGEAKVAFEQLGISQSDVLKIENDQVALLGLVADKLNNVESGAIKTKLAIEIFGGRGAELINVLDGGSEALRKFAQESKQFGSLSDKQVRSVEAFNDSVVRLQTVFANLVNKIVADLSPVLLKLSDNIRNNFLEVIKDGNDFSKKFAISIIDGAEALTLFAQQSLVAAKNIGVFGSNLFDLLNIKALFTGESFKKEFKSFEEIPKSISPELLKRFDKLRDSIRNIAEDTKGTSDNLKKVGTTAKDNVKPILGTIEDRLKRLKDASSQFGNAIANGFEKAALEGQRLKETIREIGKEIIKIAFRKAITEPLGEKLGSIIRGGIGSILGGVTGKRASGGTVQGNKPYLVGERGAEMFIPNRTGMIVPNTAMGGSVNVTQNLNIMPNVSDTVRGEIFSALPLIREQAVQAIIEARSRGGVATKALGLK